MTGVVSRVPEGGRPEADLGRQVSPERPVGSRTVDDQRGQPGSGGAEPGDSDGGLRGGVAADECPSTESRVGPPQAGPCLGDPARARRGELER